MFSVCIPAYNRVRFLPALLDSIFMQDYKDFEVVICEDMSSERMQIAALVERYSACYPGKIFYYENEENLGYDANIRNLIAKSQGRFCFFMGNDDLMCPGALASAADVINRHRNVGMVLKSYAWFDYVPERMNQEIHFFAEEREFSPGREAIRVCFRRSGAISGYIIHRESSNAIATDQFDGTLYYQMHLTAQVLVDKCAVYTPKVLVHVRSGEPPEFGNSAAEKGRFVPGLYTPQARWNMIAGVLDIIKNLKETRSLDLLEDIRRDYANYFYVYIRDQLELPIGEFFKLYRGYAQMGFNKYPLFHVYCFLAYILGDRRFDKMTKVIRGFLGRSPHFGFMK
jgi:glycosyltransferase involved in cell wall biosynthesis